MKSQSIIDLIPKPKKKILIQAKIEIDDYHELKRVLNSQNITLQSLISTFIRTFIEDIKSRKK